MSYELSPKIAIDNINNLCHENWKNFLSEKPSYLFYQSDLLKYELFISKDKKNMHYYITISLKNKKLSGVELLNFVDLSQIFVSSLQNFELKSIIVEQSEWTFCSKTLELTKNNRDLLLKILHLILIIFENIKLYLK
ncbi:MAG: hypothetical protein ACTSRP_04115 [Candidatus Helarchaeota archaeon]